MLRLTDRPEIDLQPRWSPDGRTIVFASNRTGSFQIFAMDANGSHQRQLTRRPGSSTEPTWAPGGMQIAYTHRLHGADNVDAIDVAGGALRPVTTLGGAHPSWSPDGKQIAFTRRGGVWSVLASGEAPAAPASLLASTATAPAWAPLLNAVGAVAKGTATATLPTGQTIVIGIPPPASPGSGGGGSGGGGSSGGGLRRGLRRRRAQPDSARIRIGDRARRHRRWGDHPAQAGAGHRRRGGHPDRPEGRLGDEPDRRRHEWRRHQ